MTYSEARKKRIDKMRENSGAPNWENQSGNANGTVDIPRASGTQGFLSDQANQYMKDRASPYSEAIAAQRAAAQETTAIGTTGQTENANKVSYIDENGDKQIGYANVTDQTNQQQEAERQTGAADMDYWSAMKSRYENLYSEAVKANDAQAAAAAERAKAAADEQLAALAAEYAGTNRQLYRDYMKTQKVLPQQMAAQGYTGGLAESSRLKLGISYQDALARNEQARIAAAAGINSDRAQTEYEIAAAAAEANRQALANQNAQMIALEQERYQYDQALKEAKAQQMAAAGDFSGYLEMGYSQDDVDYLTRIWLLENPEMKKAWIKAHPEDAARMGLKGSKKKSSSSGSGAKYQDYTGSNYTALLDAAIKDVGAGGSLSDVYAAAKDAAASGAISENEAASINAAAQTYASHVAQRQGAVVAPATKTANNPIANTWLKDPYSFLKNS